MRTNKQPMQNNKYICMFLFVFCIQADCTHWHSTATSMTVKQST